jgi:hypothetical protein
MTVTTTAPAGGGTGGTTQAAAPAPLRSPVVVAGPRALPRTTGILTVVPTREETGPWALGGASFESSLCGFARNGKEPCHPAEAKTFDGPGYGEGYPFFTYAGVKCDLLNVGTPYEDIARERLIATESTAVERGLIWSAFGPLTDPAHPGGITGGVVGVAAGQTAILALGEVEQALVERYGGQGIIHMDLVTAYELIAVQALHYDPLTKSLQTILGTPVSIGAGYDLYRTRKTGGPFSQAFNDAFTTATIGGAAIDGRWIFGTGAMELLRTPIVTSVALDHATNEKYALAERIYVPLIDCDLVVAAKIKTA